MNLVPLFEEALEFQDYNGTVLSDGKVAVYYIGRTRLADIYEDVAAEYPAENPRILNNLGMGPVYVNPAFDYEMVVFDAYGSELFSVKKYLASKGEHSTANVVVTPSESIAVSAWTVGDVQVYMPYLTGQLGKVYEGIEPIVVNNVEDKISANHVPLGVQDPLYFVQDDEEACIIGFSGETIPEGTMNESAFGYQDGQITSYNGSAFSAGNSYEAGSYVDIDGNTINVTGLQPAGNYQSAGDYVSASELENLQPKGDYYSASNPSGFITGVDLTDYAKTEDLTAYQPVGDYYSASNPSGFINSDAISSMATTGFVAGVSADITAMIPDTSDMATKTWVSSQGYLTAHQSLDGLMSADLLEISDNKITGYNGTAFAGTTVSGDFELSAGSGISIVDYPLDQKTVISVTAQGGNPEVEQAVIENSATWNNVSAKLDTTAFSDVSGTFLTAHQDLSDYQTIAGMTAYQEAGNYLSSNALDELSGNWETVTAKQDTLTFGYNDTAISAIDNSGLYDYSAHARINTLAGRISTLSSDKQDITGMTAYQPAGSYLSSTDSANFYTTANESGFISEVPAGTMNESAFGYDANDKISGYNGSAFAGGSDVPEGVMVESGLEYNAVNEISGYNGSAIAQYGAEKQWLVHDDTLVHASNSAQYALGVNLSAVAQLLGVDKTVLWEGRITAAGETAQLSEPLTSFNKLEFVLQLDNLGNKVDTYLASGQTYSFSYSYPFGGSFRHDMAWLQFNEDYKTWQFISANHRAWNTAGNIIENENNWQWTFYTLKQINGIGRKQ